MKKVLIFSLMVLSFSKGFSQSLDDVNDLIGQKQYLAAKTSIDKFMVKNPTDPRGWYYKGYVYNLVSKDPATAKEDVFGLKEQAYEAFKKNQQLDSKLDMMMKSEEYKSYLDLYLGYYDIGAAAFNAKDFAGAYKAFSKAQEIENYILAKKYVYTELALNKTDTALIMNTAASALQAKDTVNGIANYRRITDADIAGKDYQQVYQFLATYYSAKKDEANMTAILTKAKAAYPADNFWNEIELQGLAGDKTAMFKRYEQLFAQDPTNYNNTYNYAVEMYNSQYDKGVEKTDPAVQEKLTIVLKAAIAADPGIDAATAMSNHLYNWAADYSTDAALIKDGKAAKPEEIKKKRELEALANKKMDEAIPYSERVANYYAAKATLTSREKVGYQQALNNLSNMYNYKNNPKKAAEYDKIKATIQF